METALVLGSGLGNLTKACDALDIPRATLYRALKPSVSQESKPRPESHRALPQEVKQEIVDHLHSPRFIDRSPNEVYYTLLDEDVYLASLRSFYRILEANKESRERRNQLRHPKHKKPELIASAPNTVWTWDITKLKGPEKWEYYHLYVVLDIFSRFVVSWMLAPRESGELAKQLLEKSCQRQQIEAGQLTVAKSNIVWCAIPNENSARS